MLKLLASRGDDPHGGRRLSPFPFRGQTLPSMSHDQYIYLSNSQLFLSSPWSQGFHSFPSLNPLPVFDFDFCRDCVQHSHIIPSPTIVGLPILTLLRGNATMCSYPDSNQKLPETATLMSPVQPPGRSMIVTHVHYYVLVIFYAASRGRCGCSY